VFFAHLSGVVVISAFAKSNTRMRLRRRNIFCGHRHRFGFRHFVTERNSSRNWNARAAAVRKKSERRLRTDFYLTHHVWKNFHWRTGALLSAKTKNRDERHAEQQKNKKESAQHNF